MLGWPSPIQNPSYASTQASATVAPFGGRYKITDLYALDCCLRVSRRFASAGVGLLGCEGHERKRGTPHFRSASHCDGVAEHREDFCGE